MYDFIDVNEEQTNTHLPAEAVSINGTYLENIVAGYRTLYVKGRESLGIELNNYSVGTADGERIKGKRYPARTLTVGFQLIADSDTEFRRRFNQLNNILSLDEADFVFNDETDKFFAGYPIMNAAVQEGRNAVTGEWQIYCAYPFKRSVQMRTLSSEDATGVVVDNNSATFTFDYGGGIPAKPILRATFAGAKVGGDYNEDGDCGYVAFLNQDESIIQLGNPEVMSVETTDKSETLVNSVFNSLTGWTHDTGIHVEAVNDANWNKGAGQVSQCATGTGTLSRSIAGAINFDFDITQRLYVGLTRETFTFKALLKNGDQTVAGYVIEKTGSGTTARVNYIVDDTVVGTDNFDVARYNTHFGLCNATPIYVTYEDQTLVYKPSTGNVFNTGGTYSWETTTRTVLTGYNYTQSNLNSGIKKDADVVTFSIGNLPDRTFKASTIAGVAVSEIVFDLAGNFANAIKGFMGVASCAFIRNAAPFADIPNVFTSGDIVLADCSDANVYLYRSGSAIGHLEPQYGALGNDWENFEIKVGQNVIRAVWSDWVNENYKPKIEILFNEVYV